MEGTYSQHQKLSDLANIDFQNQRVTNDLRIVDLSGESRLTSRFLGRRKEAKAFQSTATAIQHFLEAEGLVLAHNPTATTQDDLKRLRSKLTTYLTQHQTKDEALNETVRKVHRELSRLLGQCAASKEKGWDEIAAVSPELEEILLACFLNIHDEEDVQKTLDLFVTMVREDRERAAELVSLLKPVRQKAINLPNLQALGQHLQISFHLSPNDHAFREFIIDRYLLSGNSFYIDSSFIEKLHRLAEKGLTRECSNLIDLWKAGHTDLADHLAQLVQEKPDSHEVRQLLLWANSTTASEVATLFALTPLKATDKRLLALIDHQEVMPTAVKTLLQLKAAGENELIDHCLDEPQLFQWAEAGQTELLLRIHRLEHRERMLVMNIHQPLLALQVIDLIQSGLKSDLIDWAAKYAAEHQRKNHDAQLVLATLLYMADRNPECSVPDSEQLSSCATLLKQTLTESMEQHSKLWARKLSRAGSQQREIYKANSFANAVASLLITSKGTLNTGLIPLIRQHPLFENLPAGSATKQHLDWMLTLLEQEPKITEAICRIEAPKDQTGPAAAAIRQDLRLNPKTPVTARRARRAALGALLCRLRQGRTGSCFSTGPLIGKFSTKDGVLQTLLDLREAISKGYIERNVNDTSYKFFLTQTPWDEGPAERHDNALLRSLEDAHCSLAGPGRYGAFNQFSKQLIGDDSSIDQETKGKIVQLIEQVEKELNLPSKPMAKIGSLLPTFLKQVAESHLTARFLPNHPKKGSHGEEFGSWHLELKDGASRSTHDVRDAVITVIRETAKSMVQYCSLNEEEVETLNRLEEALIHRIQQRPLQLRDFDSGGFTALLLAHDSETLHPRPVLTSHPKSAEELLETQLKWIRSLSQQEKERVKENTHARVCIGYQRPKGGHALSLLPGKDPNVKAVLDGIFSEDQMVTFWKQNVTARWSSPLTENTLIDVKHHLGRSASAQTKDCRTLKALYLALEKALGKEQAEAHIHRALAKSDVVQPLITMDTNWSTGLHDDYGGFVYNPVTKQVNLVVGTVHGDSFSIQTNQWIGDKIDWKILGSPVKFSPVAAPQSNKGL